MRTCDRRAATTTYVRTISVRFPSVRRNACVQTTICDHCSTGDLRSCVQRIRTATSFFHLANYWTSWLQPLECSVMEGS